MDKAGEAAKDYAHAVGAGDMEKACGLMTPAAKRQLLAAGAALSGHPGTCPKMFRMLVGFLTKGDMQDFRDFDVASITLTGDQAQVKPAGTQRDQTMRLRRVGGEWLVDGTGPADELGIR